MDCWTSSGKVELTREISKTTTLWLKVSGALFRFPSQNFNSKEKLLEKLYPSVLPYIKIKLGENPLKALLIYKGFAQEIMIPSLECMDHCQKL